MNEKTLAWKMLALFLGVMSLLGLVGVFIAVGSYGVFKSSAPVANSITIQGTGEITAVPDIAQIDVTVTEEGKTAVDSQTKVTTKMNKLLEYLKGQGIDEKDIKTTSYYTNPKYETQYGKPVPTPTPMPMMQSGSSGAAAGYAITEPAPAIYPCTPDYGCGTSKQVIYAYETSDAIEIKVRDTNKAGDILAGISKVGVTYTSGVTLTYDDYKKLQDEARLKAIQDARTQAEALARELGAHLGRVVSFNEGYGGPIYYAKALSADSATPGPSAPPSPEIPTGENKITSTVTVQYEIR